MRHLALGLSLVHVVVWHWQWPRPGLFPKPSCRWRCALWRAAGDSSQRMIGWRKVPVLFPLAPGHPHAHPTHHHHQQAQATFPGKVSCCGAGSLCPDGASYPLSHPHTSTTGGGLSSFSSKSSIHVPPLKQASSTVLASMPPKKKESEDDVDRLTRIAMYVVDCACVASIHPPTSSTHPPTHPQTQPTTA